MRPGRRRIETAVARIALVLLAAPAHAADGPPVRVDTRTWRQANAVYAIAQAPDGFLWFGTQSGLRRFDGLSFTDFNVTVTPELGDNHCRVLLAARNGDLWIGTGSGFARMDPRTSIPTLQYRLGRGGLVRQRQGAFKRFSEGDGFGEEWVWALAEDRAGSIWIGTERGLARWDQGRFSRFSARDGLPGEFVTSLLVDAAGELWIGTNAGLAVWRAGRFVVTDVRDAILSMAADKQGGMWLSTARGLVHRDRQSQGRLWPVPQKLPASSLQVDGQDVLWIGTEYGLLARKRASETLAEDPPPAPAPFANPDHVDALLVDREQSLWVGTRTGEIVQARQPWIWNLGRSEGLPGESAFATLAGRDGSIWISCNDGLARWKDGALTTYASGAELPHTLRSLAEGPDGSIWVASAAQGIARLGADHFTIYKKGDNVRGKGAAALHFDKRGALWVAWSEGGVTRYDSGTMDSSGRPLTEADGLCPGVVGSIADGAGDRMWFGGVGGVAVRDGDRRRCYPRGPDIQQIGPLLDSGDGDLWIGTLGGSGLARLRGEQLSWIPATSGLRMAAAFGLADDGTGYLFISSFIGVARVAKADVRAYLARAADHIPLSWIGTEDGMRTHECTGWLSPGAVLDGQGRFWVPTKLGVSVIPPVALRPRMKADAIIESVLSDGNLRDPSGPVDLPSGGDDLAIHFAAPNFLFPARLAVRYRLDLSVDGGGDPKGWVDAGSQRSARYQHLRAGRYTFRVQAFDDAGRPAGREAVLSLSVPVPFHRSWWFFAACAAASVLVGLGLHAARIRQIRGRYAATQAERARIARDLHDNLAQGFASIGLHMDVMKQTFEHAPPSVLKLLDQTREVVDACKEQTRRSIWNIRVEGLQSPTLGGVLRKALADIPRPARTEIALDVSAPRQPVGGMLEQEIGFIVREAVLNAVTHGEATRIVVEARLHGTELHLSVKDDGRGIAAPAPDLGKGAPSGIGIIGMRERAFRLGGTISVTSAPGHGTEVALVVPYDDPSGSGAA